MLLIINQRILNRLIIDISINCPSPSYLHWSCSESDANVEYNVHLVARLDSLIQCCLLPSQFFTAASVCPSVLD